MSYNIETTSANVTLLLNLFNGYQDQESKKFPSGSLVQADFLAGQVICKAYLSSRQGSRQVML